MKLWEYVDKKVKITLRNKQEIVGNVELYTSFLDNEPEPESITVRNINTNSLIELFDEDILKLELV